MPQGKSLTNLNANCRQNPSKQRDGIINSRSHKASCLQMDKRSSNRITERNLNPLPKPVPDDYRKQEGSIDLVAIVVRVKSLLFLARIFGQMPGCAQAVSANFSFGLILG